MGSPEIPWKKLREYFFRLNACRSPKELFHEASVGIYPVIPFDETAGIFDERDGFNLEGIGKTEAVTAAFNDYYRTIRPAVMGPVVDWRRWADHEYVAEFIRPNHQYRILRDTTSGVRYKLRVARSGGSPDYTDSDVETLVLVNQHLNAFLAMLQSQAPTQSVAGSARGLRERVPALSQREAEICSLVMARLATWEIGASFCISPRTVEKHLESIFSKLSVYSRPQLRRRLGSLAMPLQQGPVHLGSLSKREAEVCNFMARRWNNNEIAAHLLLSPRTVEKYVERIFFKLDVRSRDELRWRIGAVQRFTT